MKVKELIELLQECNMEDEIQLYIGGPKDSALTKADIGVQRRFEYHTREPYVRISGFVWSDDEEAFIPGR